MEGIDTYTRTIRVPVRTLSAKKVGMVNRAMKDYRRARELVCDYFRKPDTDPFDFGYGEREDLRKSISAHSRVSLPSRCIYPAIATVEQNYKEFEQDGRATEPEANRPDTLALEGQNARIFHTDGTYYLNVATGRGAVNLPLRTSTDAYHDDRLPHPESVPATGRRRTGVPFADLDPEDFPDDVVKLSTSTLSKTGCRQFVANLVFQHAKRVSRSIDETPRHLVGVDRGRNELAYAAVYNTADDHVTDWENVSGDETEHYMDRFAERIREFQSAGVWEEMDAARERRYRYKRQRDYELANAIVDAARGHLDVAIVLEDLSNLSRLGGYARESRRFAEWSYYRQAEYIRQKAEPYDIPVIEVGPQFTSQECSRCGSADTSRSGVHFTCRDCDHDQHADANAAVNIAKRAASSEVSA